MILKTKDGHYFELTENEYGYLIVELMCHFKTENKLVLNVKKDMRIEAAKLLLNTAASVNMSQETKEGYLKTAHELIEKYNSDFDIETKK